MKRFAVLLFSFALPCLTYSATTFYGKSFEIKQQYRSPYYIQLGAFQNAHLAASEKTKYQHLGYPIKLEQHGRLTAVILGPLSTSSQLMAVKSALNAKSIQRPQRPPKRLKPLKTAYYPYRKKPNSPNEKVNQAYAKLNPQKGFQVGIAGGAAYASINTPVTVPNGSNYPRPQNVDAYSANASAQGTLMVYGGKNFKPKLKGLQDLWLGVRYQYFIPQDMGGTITQYSLPQFRNYNYNMSISSNLFTLDGRWTFPAYRLVSPYINAGIGFSLNQFGGFKESALPNVTPRYSPAFASQTDTQFTYHAGAGLSLSIQPQLNLYLGYEFVDLGNLASGLATGPDWPPEKLSFGRYYANTGLIGLNYNFG